MKKLISIVFLSTLIISVFVLWKGGEIFAQQTPGHGNAEIKVYENSILCRTLRLNCKTIANAIVSLYDSNGNLAGLGDASSGTAYFANLPVGAYTVKVTAPTYSDAQSTITVKKDKTAKLTVYLTKAPLPGSAEITVYENSTLCRIFKIGCVTISNAIVSLYDSNNNLIGIMDTSLGTATFTGLNAGEYTAKVEAIGYLSSQTTLSVSWDKTTKITIYLAKAPISSLVPSPSPTPSQPFSPQPSPSPSLSPTPLASQSSSPTPTSTVLIQTLTPTPTISIAVTPSPFPSVSPSPTPSANSVTITAVDKTKTCSPQNPQCNIILNATISLYSQAGNLIESKETSTGNVVFQNLAPGLYSVRIKAPGYSSAKIELIVNQNGTIQWHYLEEGALQLIKSIALQPKGFYFYPFADISSILSVLWYSVSR